MDSDDASGIAVVTDDGDVAERLAAGIGREHVQVVTKRGLDGGVVEWIVIVTVASRFVHAAAALALRYLELTRVRSIHVRNDTTGVDVTIEHPNRDDVERLLAVSEEGPHDA